MDISKKDTPKIVEAYFDLIETLGSKCLLAHKVLINHFKDYRFI
ncbi:hypothetical protein [Clostridium diolis]|nr:hypothetical protein [Clostridium diolis]